MFSARASVETLRALHAMARDERRTVRDLFEEAVGLLLRSRQHRGVVSRAETDSLSD
jgi:hypothetical protein